MSSQPYRIDALSSGQGAPQLGKFFSEQWQYRYRKNKKAKLSKDSPINLNNNKRSLRSFVKNVLTELDKPTLVLIERDNWGQEDILREIKDTNLFKTETFLGFERSDEIFENVIAVLRLQTGNDTPQYLIDDIKHNLKDLTFPMGFIDDSIPSMPYYYSIGERLSSTKESYTGQEGIALMYNGSGAGIINRHPQVVEFTPFFICEDFNSQEQKIMLCRIAHYLRVNPSWEHGSPVYPHPMHLAKTMIEDQLAVLALD